MCKDFYENNTTLTKESFPCGTAIAQTKIQSPLEFHLFPVAHARRVIPRKAYLPVNDFYSTQYPLRNTSTDPFQIFNYRIDNNSTTLDVVPPPTTITPL